MGDRRASDEYYVLGLCDEVLREQSERQKRFDWLRGDLSPRTGRRSALPVDGYWPEANIAVEFHERQHADAVPLFDARQTVSGVTRREQRRLYDARKAEALADHDIRLVVIPQTAFKLKRRRIDRDPQLDCEIVRRLLMR